jgi:hypothetical protein
LGFWILWERVVNLTDQSERWIDPTSQRKQQVCVRDTPSLIDDLNNHFLQRGLGAAYVFGEGVGGISINIKRSMYLCATPLTSIPDLA